MSPRWREPNSSRQRIIVFPQQGARSGQRRFAGARSGEADGTPVARTRPTAVWSEAPSTALDPPISDGNLSLEVRWILPGVPAPEMIEWFGPSAAGVETRRDSYLVNQASPDVGVKLRGDVQLDVKIYGGSPNIVTVPGRAQGRLGWWRKWSFPLRAFDRAREPARWAGVQKVRRIRFFSLAGRPILSKADAAVEGGCAVELTEVLVDRRRWWTLGFEATGPASALTGELDASLALMFDHRLAGRPDPGPSSFDVVPRMAGGSLARRFRCQLRSTDACRIRIAQSPGRCDRERYVHAEGHQKYSEDHRMPLIEYDPSHHFPGEVGRTADESSPAWPAPKRAVKGSPNVLFIVLDDTGFGQLGCFGSPIATPNLDALAANGLRYNNMHTTALCSPSRSCIITGRNHHSNAMACVTEFATGFPGYNGNVPFENGFLSEMLLARGYSTYMIGKWHLIPSSQESGAGPYDRWPLGRGFERFYGFLGGDTSQWNPDLVYDNHQVDPPATPEQGYHLTPDLVDKAVEFIADAKQIDPDKPFFLHFCPGATHAPHHVPKEWADKYAGQFDDGWDAYRTGTFARQKELGVVPADCELSRHDPDVPDWAALSDDQRRLYAREMEVFAGFLSHTDHHIGRLIEFLQQHRRARQHADHGGLRQRGQRRRWCHRHHQRGPVLQQLPRTGRGQPEA